MTLDELERQTEYAEVRIEEYSMNTPVTLMRVQLFQHGIGQVFMVGQAMDCRHVVEAAGYIVSEITPPMNGGSSIVWIIWDARSVEATR